MRIGLSYHGGDADYETYPQALHRRAQALGIEIATEWLGGRERQNRLDLLPKMDAVLLTGGPDVEPARYGHQNGGLSKTDPPRDALEWALLEWLKANRLPTLAVCRGAQIVNVFHGGTLIQDLGEQNTVHSRDERRDRQTHSVAVSEGTRLARITGLARAEVNTSHHQAVDRLAEGFQVSAVSEDGVIEAFEPIASGGPLLLAVQWHPEGMEPGLPLGERVLDALLKSQH